MTKGNQRHQNWQRSQTFTFADDMILYMENPKDSTKKLLEMIHEFSKVAGYTINVQKSVAFLYTKSEATEREIKESIPFTVAPKNHKIPRNNPKEMKSYTLKTIDNISKKLKKTHKQMEKDAMLLDRKDKHC